MSQILQISPLGTQNTVITKGSYVWRVCEGPQWSQSPRRLGNLTRSSLVTFSLRRPHRQSPAIVRGTNQYKLVTSNDEQGRARRTKGGAPCLLGHINVAFKRHVSPHVFAIAKHPFTCVCFSQTLSHMSAPGKPQYNWGLYRNQTFSLYPCVLEGVWVSPSGSEFLTKWLLCGTWVFSLGIVILRLCSVCRSTSVHYVIPACLKSDAKLPLVSYLFSFVTIG